MLQPHDPHGLTDIIHADASTDRPLGLLPSSGISFQIQVTLPTHQISQETISFYGRETLKIHSMPNSRNWRTKKPNNTMLPCTESRIAWAWRWRGICHPNSSSTTISSAFTHIKGTEPPTQPHTKTKTNTNTSSSRLA